MCFPVSRPSPKPIPWAWGLGLVALGLILRSDSWRDVAMLLLIWLVAMASGAVTCQLYARFERERQRPSGREEGAP